MSEFASLTSPLITAPHYFTSSSSFSEFGIANVSLEPQIDLQNQTQHFDVRSNLNSSILPINNSNNNNNNSNNSNDIFKNSLSHINSNSSSIIIPLLIQIEPVHTDNDNLTNEINSKYSQNTKSIKILVPKNISSFSSAFTSTVTHSSLNSAFVNTSSSLNSTFNSTSLPPSNSTLSSTIDSIALNKSQLPSKFTNNCEKKIQNTSSSTHNNFFSNNIPFSSPSHSSFFSSAYSFLDPNSSKPLSNISSSAISRSFVPSPIPSFPSLSSNHLSETDYYSKFPFHTMINSNLSSDITDSSEFSSSKSSFLFSSSSGSGEKNYLQKNGISKKNSVNMNDSFISQTKLLHSSVKRKKDGMCQCRECIRLVYFILFDSIE
jgi:hypothetical protein